MYKILCLGIFIYVFSINVLFGQVTNQKYYISEPVHQYNIKIYAYDQKGILLINQSNDTSKVTIACKGEWGFQSLFLGKQNDRLVNNECLNGYVGELVIKNQRNCNYVSENSYFLIPPNDSMTLVMNDYSGSYNDNWGYLEGTLTIETKIIPRLSIIKPIHKLENSFSKNKVLANDTTAIIEEIPKLKINKNHQIPCISEEINLIISDHQKEDGDIIDIYVNNKLVQKDFELMNQSKTITIPLTYGNKFNILIRAVNMGKIPPCTSTIKIQGCDINDPLIIQSDLLSTEMITLYRSEF